MPAPVQRRDAWKGGSVVECSRRTRQYAPAMENPQWASRGSNPAPSTLREAARRALCSVRDSNETSRAQHREHFWPWFKSRPFHFSRSIAPSAVFIAAQQASAAVGGTLNRSGEA